MTEEVRLKGFSKRAPLDDVLAWIRSAVDPIGVERLPFRSAEGRVLAEDVVSKVNVPAFHRAAMDGFAVRSADVPGDLAIVGELTAAERAPRPLGDQEAMRVMTGARIPDGADSVVMVEHATVLEERRVQIDDPAPAGRHILRVGEDIAKDRPVLTAGRWIKPQDLAMAVQAGALELTVRRKPRVLIMPTGTELLKTGEIPNASQVVESNSFMLEALARRDGAEPILHPIVRDDRETMKAIMQDCRADVLVISGGSSVGREDFAPVVANEIGDVAFHGIALKPASSTGVGRIGQTWVVLGPGYPVAAYVAWDLVVRPLIFRLLGTPERWPYRTIRARLAAPYRKRGGRTEIARVEMRPAANDLPSVTVLPGGSAILSTLTRGAGFLYLADSQGPLQTDEEVDVHLFD